MRIAKSTSLARDFLVFSAIILVVTFTVAGGYWMYGYHTDLQKRQRQLEDDATRVSLLLADYMDHVSQYAGFLGQRMADSSNNLKDIAKLIGCHEGEKFHFMTTFDWVTPDKQLRASSCIGVLQQPFDMRDRDYLVRTQEQPWKLQLSGPRYGGISKHWIIPAGMGITDKNGKFLGSVTTGFGISELSYRLKHLLGGEGNGLRFLVLTRDGKLVLDSEGDNTVPPATAIPLDTKALGNITGALMPLEYDGYRFSYQQLVPGYPLRVLTGFSNAMPRQLFVAAVLPGLAILLAAIAAAAVLLHFMRRRLIHPVLDLSQQAERIASGMPVTIANSHVAELAMLEQQMQRISSYLAKEKQTSELLIQQTELLRHKTAALQSANKKALEARDAAIKAGQAKSEFLANMSHEIRTPLNAVIGLTSLMRMRTYPPERQKELLDTVQVSANQLLQLINDLLDLSKIEGNQMVLENVPFDLNEIIDEVIAINQISAAKQGIQLAIGRSVALPRLMGDPMRIRQVLINLVGNAVKFTPKGSVTVHLDCQVPTHSLMHVRISVEDTGVGIPPEKLEFVFGKFSQADASISRQYGGTGLGLSISKNLVELMGGAIAVESTVHAGSTFSFTLDLERADYTAPETIVGSAANTDAKLQTLRLLVVEDNPTNIFVMQNLLDMLGCHYDVVTNGHAALQRIATTHYDVVLMDVQMPEMDGYQVTRQLREREEKESRARLYVIGLTAHSLQEDRDKGMLAGMDDYLAKPFEPNDLIRALQNYVAQSQQSQLLPQA